MIIRIFHGTFHGLNNMSRGWQIRITNAKVDDIHAATETLHRRGVTITETAHLVAKMPDHDLWMSFFEDSEGNTLALMAEVREEGSAP